MSATPPALEDGAMLEKHTPGPWAVSKNSSGRRVTSVTGIVICNAVLRNTGRADRGVSFGSKEHKEAEANARLIAGAPDHALLIWAMCVQDGAWEEWAPGKGEFCFAGMRYVASLDEFGCPIMTHSLRAAILAARGSSSNG